MNGIDYQIRQENAVLSISLDTSNNKNILIIASYIENGIETYDLRMNEKQQQIWIDWSCQACTFINNKSATKCVICNTPNKQSMAMNYDYGWRGCMVYKHNIRCIANLCRMCLRQNLNNMDLQM